MKKHIQIRNSYNIWNPSKMKQLMNSNSILLIIEWWIHNVGYYLTLPFIHIEQVRKLNERLKHVDLLVDDDD